MICAFIIFSCNKEWAPLVLKVLARPYAGGGGVQVLRILKTGCRIWQGRNSHPVLSLKRRGGRGCRPSASLRQGTGFDRVSLYTILYTMLYTVHCTVHCTVLCTVHCTVHSTVRCNVHCTLYIVLYTVRYTVLYTLLYTVHCAVNCTVSTLILYCSSVMLA